MVQSSQKIDLTTPGQSACSQPTHREKNCMPNLRQQQQDQRKAKPPTPLVHPPFPRRQRSQDDFFQVTGKYHHPLDKNQMANEPNGMQTTSRYVLGETVRSASDMSIEQCPQKAAEMASYLKNYDFAFIKRSNGSWTYAILVCRVFLTSGNNQKNSREEGMLFVVSDKGCIKMIRKPYWAEFIRVVTNKHSQNISGGNGKDASQEVDAGKYQRLLQESVCIDNDCDENSCISF